MHIAGTLYQIRPAGEFETVIEVNQDGFVDELEPDAPDYEVDPELDAELDTTWPQKINVLVAYTKKSATASSDILSEIDLAIDETNQGYKNSGVTQRINLAKTIEVDYDETLDLRKDRDRLQKAADGHLDEVLKLRDEVKADLVSFWVEDSNGGACGIAYIMKKPSVAFAPWGVSVVKRSCATGYYSFGHELAHIMGARHDHYVDPTNNSPYTYNHAYFIPQLKYRTIMGYNNGCRAAGESCTRINFYSNPRKMRGGKPMGIPEGKPKAADNATTLNNTSQYVSSFR